METRIMLARINSALFTILLLGIGLSILADKFQAQTLPEISTFVDNHPANAVVTQGLGDVNADGKDDYSLVVFHPGTAPGLSGASDGVVISGGDGTLIADYRIATAPSGVVFGIHGLGDLDGDVFAEYLTLERDASIFSNIRIEVRSGLTHASNFTIGLGNIANVAILQSTSIGDLDGDGIREIGLARRDVLGFDSGQVQIEVLSGGTGSQIFGISTPFLMSSGIGDLGDLDGDGTSDFFISRTLGNSFLQGPYSAGVIEIYSGAGLGIINFITGQYATQGLGYQAYAVSDLDSDGLRDIISLSIDSGPFSVSQSAIYEAYSSATGNPIWVVPAPANSHVFDLKLAGDQNGDGIDDFVTLVQTAGSSFRFRELRSGADGSILEILANSESVGIGSSSSSTGALRADAFVGDLNGDGIADRLEHQITGVGTVVTTGHTHMAAQSYGISAATSLGLRYDPFAAQPRLGTYEVAAATPFASLLIAASLSPASTTIVGTSFPLLVSVGYQDLILTANLTADAFGIFRAPLGLSLPAIAGTVVYLQVAEIAPFPAVSNGLEVLFGP